MNKDRFCKLWLSLAGFLVAAGMGVGITQSALAQIIEDDTLGSESSVITSDVVIRGISSNQIDGGAIRGANLFHSFEQFGVEVDRGVYFTNPDGVDNILSRVTGSDPSNIFGTLGVLGQANLFFLNPNGILFGPEARLDLQGSFLATTADGLVFPNGDTFSALDPQPPSLLTVSAPLGLQYGPQPSGAIVAQDSDLRLESGQSLVLAGGAVNLDNSLLAVEGGQIELGAVAGVGTVGLDVNGDRLSLDFPDDIERADISLTNGSVLDVTAEDGGGVTITARDLDILAGSELLAGIASGLGAEGNQAGDITLNATGAIHIGQASVIRNNVFSDAIGSSGDIHITAEAISVTGGSQLSASTLGKGNAGDVIIEVTETASFDGFNSSNGNSSSARSNIALNGEGAGGDVRITAANLEVANGAQLIAATFGRGDAGNVIIEVTETASFDGFNSSNDNPSGAFSDIALNGAGAGGDVRITAANLEVANGAQLIAATFGRGDAGNVIIEVTETASFDGFNSLTGAPSAAFSGIGLNGEGAGGDVRITAANLEVVNGGQLIAAIFGQGDAGDVTIEVTETASFDGFNSLNDRTPSGAFSSIQPDGKGTGGDVRITAANLEVANGAQLNTATFGRGDAGDVIIEVTETASFDGFNSSNGAPSGALSSIQPGGEGDGGDVHITAANLEVTNGARLSASTFGWGDAGDVIIEVTETASFDGFNSLNGDASGARSSVAPDGEGDGGDVRITAANLEVANGAQLGGNSTGFGNAGNVILHIRERLLANDGTIATNATFASGGEIIINAGDIRLEGDSDIQTFVNVGEGSGGDIVITADSVIAFDDSDILAFAQDGRGGDITLNTSAFFGENFRPDATVTDPEELDGNDRVDLNASGAVSGVISLPDVTFIENDLVELPERAVNPDVLVASSCVVRSQAQTGRFIITGSDSLPERPGEVTILPYSTGTIRPLPSEQSSDAGEALPWRRGEPIVESQGVYPLTDGRLVLSRECS